MDGSAVAAACVGAVVTVFMMVHEPIGGRLPRDLVVLLQRVLQLLCRTQLAQKEDDMM